MACRPDRSPIPDAPRWKPRPIRRAPVICSSSPTAPAATPLPKPTISIRRTSPNYVRRKSKFRMIRSSRLTIRHHRRRRRPRRPTPAPRLRPPRSRLRRKSPPVRRGRVRRNRPRRPRRFRNSADAAGRLEPNFTFVENVLRSRLLSANLTPVPSGEIHAMPLSSMTGFARSHGASGPYAFEWELKSVNAKGFDLRMRLPPGWDELEALAKKRAGELLSRGTVYANLNVKRTNAVSTIRINEEVLASIVKVAGVLAGKIDAVAPSIDGLLAIKGVVEVVEPESDEAEDKAAKAAAAAAFEQALADLIKMRQREGVTLGQILSQRMDEIEKLAKKAEAAPGRKPEAIKARLAEQIAALLESSERFDSDRLNQEAIMIAAKADIREELDRIASHISQAREMIGKGGPVGRRLDFLAQEFNREVNTCCSKSNDLELTNTGLEMKNVVEQFREQVQNLE